MESILYEIFRDSYDITPKKDEKWQELEKKLCAEWDKIQAALGDAFTDHLLDLEGELDSQRAFHYYRAGFRLCARLILEVFTPATA